METLKKKVEIQNTFSPKNFGLEILSLSQYCSHLYYTCSLSYIMSIDSQNACMGDDRNGHREGKEPAEWHPGTEQREKRTLV